MDEDGGVSSGYHDDPWRYFNYYYYISYNELGMRFRLSGHLK